MKHRNNSVFRIHNRFYFIIFSIIQMLVTCVSMAQIISTTDYPYNFGTGDASANPKGFTNNNEVISSDINMPGGVYNFVNFTIDSGVIVTVTGTVPVVIKCTGTANIYGIIQATGGNGGNNKGFNGGVAGIGGGGGGKSGGIGGYCPNDGEYGNNGNAGINYGTCNGGGGYGEGGGFDFFENDANGGGGGGGSYGTVGGAGGNGTYGIKGGAAGNIYNDNNLSQVCGGSTNISGGSGGGGGGAFDGYGYECFSGGSGVGGAGGGGGGGGIAIIAGTIDLKGGYINVSGGNGGNGTNISQMCSCTGLCDYSGSGGGGSGGTVLLEYKIKCDSCTISNVNINGGIGGGGGAPAGGNGGMGRFIAIQDTCTKFPAFKDTIPNQVRCEGDSITFSVLPVETGNLSYQWIKNKNNIIDATNSIFKIQHLKTDDESKYSCLIKNSCGNKYLPEFRLNVYGKPVYSLPLKQYALFDGDSASFIVYPKGDAIFTYQWFKNDSIISGATSFNYKLSTINLKDSGIYKCRINNSCDSIIAEILHLAVIPVSRFRHDISGTVNYDNNLLTPVNNIKVYLYQLVTDKFVLTDSSVTDSAGAYIFKDLLNGYYHLMCKINKPWGGVNPVDALLVNRTFIGVYFITDILKKQTADVNNDTRINPVDALLINRRYIKAIKSFNVNDWIIETPSLIMSDTNVAKNIKAICAGDVNGSY